MSWRNFLTSLNNGTCLGKPPGGFCDIGCCCCFYLTGGFYISGILFLATGTPAQLLRPREGPPLALRFTPATFGCFTFVKLFRHSFTASAMVLGGRFLPADVFYLMLLHRHFWHVFVTQMRAGKPLLGFTPVPALIELSLPADAWTLTSHIVVTRPLIYQLRQWATKYRVKIKLLNTFACSKSYVKTIKIHFEQDLVLYCL